MRGRRRGAFRGGGRGGRASGEVFIFPSPIFWPALFIFYFSSKFLFIYNYNKSYMLFEGVSRVASTPALASF